MVKHRRRRRRKSCFVFQRTAQILEWEGQEICLKEIEGRKNVPQASKEGKVRGPVEHAKGKYLAIKRKELSEAMRMRTGKKDQKGKEKNKRPPT